MKKEDVEKIMDTSYPYLKEKAPNLTLIDMVDIASKTWVDLQNEPKKDYEDIVEYILIDRDQWSEFKYSRSLPIDIDGHKLEFMYKPNAFRLESGEIVDCDTDPDEGEELPDHFFDFECPEKLDSVELELNIIPWIVDNIKQIQDVVRFDIKNLQRNKQFENHHRVELYAEDSFGNGIVFYGDSEESTDETLSWILFKAIVSASQKVVWVANDVQNIHACIINWLNENHVGGMMFYLIEAKRIAISNNKTAATGFRLVEGPDTGQMDLV